MTEDDRVAAQFEACRSQLKAIAYRVLGSHQDAEDAVQEAWIRLARADQDTIDGIPAWLTTVTVRICLNVLRARRNRREESVGMRIPDPLIVPLESTDPAELALTADSIGLAFQVVVDELSPPERVAFVLHDVFDLPFEDIATLLDRSVSSTRQLASRARRRVRGAGIRTADSALSTQREAVEAFFVAARARDMRRLVEVLDPDVVLHSDGGTERAEATTILRGVHQVSSRAATFALPGARVRHVTVNGTAGVLVTVAGRPVSVMAFTVRGGRIVEIHTLVDPGRVPYLHGLVPPEKMPDSFGPCGPGRH